MTSDHDPFTHHIEAWLDLPATEERPDEVLSRVGAGLDALPQRRSVWPAWERSPALRRASLALLAVGAVVAVVALAGARGELVVVGPPPGEPAGPVASSSPGPSLAPSANIHGIPPAGARLSSAEPGQLVLRLEGNLSEFYSLVWVFADGRVITHETERMVLGAGDDYVGFLERQLTPDGVEFLRSAAVSTGLFEHDLSLRSDGKFVFMEVRDGDQTVSLSWAWSGFAESGTPAATEEQAEALIRLSDLLTHPSSWPGSASDQDPSAYVPPQYAICVRGLPQPVATDYAWSLLPDRAQDLLQAGQLRGWSPTATKDAAKVCSVIATDDARALANVFQEAGITRDGAGILYAPDWVRYSVRDPGTPQNRIWFSFAPVLPDGEAVWLGPG